MKTVNEVTKLTGTSARTLQYYDEIGLLKPSKRTGANYRLYDDEALQRLQQILFFKELGFSLKEIGDFLNRPDFDRISAFRKQKELLLLKRNRTDRLIQLLSRLEKGEQCMSFKEFDLTDYIHALENFKKKQPDDITKYWGGLENFNMFVNKVKEEESQVAQLAITHFGSVENYTNAMKYNLEHFSEIMESKLTDDVKKIAEQSDALYAKLTSDMTKDVSSEEIQHIVEEITTFVRGNTPNPFDAEIWSVIADSYSSDFVKTLANAKLGDGASDYIVRAFRYYGGNKAS